MEKQTSHKLLVIDEYMQIIKYNIQKTIGYYLDFLVTITDKIMTDTNDNETNQRKFIEVRQELLKFVKYHKNLVTLKNCTVKANTRDMTELNFGCLSSADKFIDFENFVIFVIDMTEIYRKNEDTVNFLVVTYEPSGCVTFLEQVFGKPKAEITNEDMLNFENISFLNDQKWKDTKCSYAELREKVNRRQIDCINNTISAERIEELSLTFDETTEHMVADKECSICKEGYENGQLLCRMPCNHFFHKHCIAKWFKPQNSSSDKPDPADSQNDIEEDVESRRNEEINHSDIISMLNTLLDKLPEVPQYDIEDDQIPDNDIEEDEIPENDIEEDEIPDYNTEEHEIPDYEMEDIAIPEYDIEDDVPNTTKFQCPNCRENCC